MAQWNPSDGSEPVLSCAILTTAASGHMTHVHDRMPVVLSGNAQTAWLDRGVEDSAAALDIAKACNAPEALEYHPVSTLVNNTRQDSEELIRRDDLR